MVALETIETPKKNVYEEIADLEPKKEGRFWQMDFLKVFAMLLVIMDHSTTHAELKAIGSPFWERIAIPIFMIVLGFNWAKSLQKHKYVFRIANYSLGKTIGRIKLCTLRFRIV